MFTQYINDDISLKLLEKQDAQELFILVDKNRNYLKQWLPWVDNMKQEEDYEPVIDMWLNQFSSHNGFQAGILYKGELTGMVGFHGIDRANKKTSIGYWLGESYQGNGIMTIAVKALIDQAFHEYGLNRVEIQCGVDNKKSRSIPERLGFNQDGLLRDAEYLYDHFHDCVLYSMLAKEWE
ncbi:GNAT family N-acetyltransferase [Virgibacillus halodenitrificans]|uniref:GNAT family N-acetyltransferase n=1 Tax=Virgibacillus halodenitrificans TaxID=1482 RepID=UPI001FB438C4|nr:GNAT family protein [Virgibacillus halodenitrificans]MCJ0932033.1 GNAT family N-acetyltransferase [Virgibacillus halodenitrificans]